jgi:hypothetical protein
LKDPLLRISDFSGIDEGKYTKTTKEKQGKIRLAILLNSTSPKQNQRPKFPSEI